MKDSITNSIIQQMLSVLDNAQLKQLKKAIEATLTTRASFNEDIFSFLKVYLARLQKDI